MKRIATLDAESDPFKEGRIPAPFLWGLYDGEDYYEFDKTQDMVAFISDKDWRIYAHNGGKFDFHFLLKHIPTWEKIILINGRLVQFKIGKATLQDSYTILPDSLKSLTQSTTTKKREISFDIFEPEERNKPENNRIIRTYLKDDCVSLHEIVSRFIDTHGYSLTIASAAIKKLQKIEGIKIENSGKEFYDSIKPYYYGGRVECFRKGLINRPVTYLDINSAYPYAMIHKHPWGDMTTDNSARPKLVDQHFYTLEAGSTGAFPFRTKDGLTFPADGQRRVFNVTGWELRSAKDLGLLHDPRHISQIVCSQVRDYAAYVNYFYEIKKSAKKGSPENIFAKLFLNSAYGKFAANPESYRSTYLIPPEDVHEALAADMMLHGEFSDYYVVSEPTDEDERRYYNVAVGASITGFVRAYLLRAIKSVSKPLYCDTDSLVFQGPHHLKLGDDLGQWKIEGKFQRGAIGGKKLYVFENDGEKPKLATKGARLTAAQVYAICKGEIIEYSAIAPVFSVKNGVRFTKKKLRMT